MFSQESSKNLTNSSFVRNTQGCLRAFNIGSTMFWLLAKIIFSIMYSSRFVHKGEKINHILYIITYIVLEFLNFDRPLCCLFFGSRIASCFLAKICFLFLEKHFICCKVCTHYGMFHCPSQPTVMVPVVCLKDQNDC